MSNVRLELMIPRSRITSPVTGPASSIPIWGHQLQIFSAPVSSEVDPQLLPIVSSLGPLILPLRRL